MNLNNNWTTNNNNFDLNSKEVERYISVLPSSRQLKNAEKPFYAFMHFGMNTSTNREWGNATETCEDFKITKIDVQQWVSAIKASTATGIILTCKHHDGFCLWATKATDFNVMNTAFGKDVVKMLSDECHKQGMNFGVYLSPWDMHEKSYATPEYNDFFCTQLTELLSNYGEIFEVWFDGAKGKEAKAFEYDWQRYYDIIRKLQPNANISICGPDLRWVGNEGGKSRKSEFSVVPRSLTDCEKTQKKSQNDAAQGTAMQKVDSKDEDLGSRDILENEEELVWYPAEVDVSIRKGWFHHKNQKPKSLKKLMHIYITSVGNNCSLLLNVPPSKKGVVSNSDVRRLKAMGREIKRITEKPVVEKCFGELTEADGYLEFDFKNTTKLKYCVLEEDISKGQRVENFDLFLKLPNGEYRKAYDGTIIGSKKIIELKSKAVGAVLVVRQSRSNPVLKLVGFYE